MVHSKGSATKCTFVYFPFVSLGAIVAIFLIHEHDVRASIGMNSLTRGVHGHGIFSEAYSLVHDSSFLFIRVVFIQFDLLLDGLFNLCGDSSMCWSSFTVFFQYEMPTFF